MKKFFAVICCIFCFQLVAQGCTNTGNVSNQVNNTPVIVYNQVVTPYQMPVLVNDSCTIRKRNGVIIKYEGSCYYERYFNHRNGCNRWSCRK